MDVRRGVRHGRRLLGPTREVPSLRQAVAFLLPGALLLVLALLDFGFWCGGWLLGLPAWGGRKRAGSIEKTLAF
jgi:hypothetical protein